MNKKNTPSVPPREIPLKYHLSSHPPPHRESTNRSFIFLNKKRLFLLPPSVTLNSPTNSWISPHYYHPALYKSNIAAPTNPTSPAPTLAVAAAAELDELGWLVLVVGLDVVVVAKVLLASVVVASVAVVVASSVVVVGSSVDVGASVVELGTTVEVFWSEVMVKGGL